jgi:hypothetical protein
MRGEMAGHLVPPGSVSAFLAEYRRELCPDSFTPPRTPGPGLRRGRGGDRADRDLTGRRKRCVDSMLFDDAVAT